ncbi:MAG: zinc ribbon domain-containing protein [Desulfobacterales bacterium]|nr:zinc ribbon domain-containing protein [Desulfobacterales bacterium]
MAKGYMANGKELHSLSPACRLLALSLKPQAKTPELRFMPLYDYECAKCAHVFEVFHKIDEVIDDLACPKCKAKRPRKLVSQFKTNQWSQFLDTMERKISPHKFK